jgi:aspartyl-tRNA(Asn)/glutamyl-tRNA(Gln) amidotransferase subunit B
MIDSTVDEVIKSNSQAVEDYLRGKESAVKFLVGQVMKSTKGQANPVLATEAIQEKLKALGKR